MPLPAKSSRLTNLWEIFLTFLQLGMTSFGGPVAHLGYFRQEFVVKRQWLDEPAYADVVALCQFLPGPASSQVGAALGFKRGGFFGACLAWLGFTLPSAVLLVLFALELNELNSLLGTAWIHGLKLVAVAVIAQALWGMGKSLAPDKERASIVVLATISVSLFPTPLGQIGTLVAAAIIGLIGLRDSTVQTSELAQSGGQKITGVICLAVFLLILTGLPVLAQVTDSYPVRLVDSFFRAGALVFGGGHVVLPVLQAEVVPVGWVSASNFMAGYGAAQAVPGPLFTFAAFLGAISDQAPAGWLGGLLALVAIFLPGFLLVLGCLPFWDHLRKFQSMQCAMRGVNAAVVGLLLAAFFNPVWTSAISSSRDFCFVLVAYVLLVFWKLPPWLVVILGALGASAGLA
ncbi:MAG: chromate efflux transporter [Betaproteobacteria bacterium]